MKTINRRSSVSRKRSTQRGVAVIVVLALLAIILLYIGANARTLYQLGRELKVIERHQLHRLAQPQSRTNSIPAPIHAAPAQP